MQVGVLIANCKPKTATANFKLIVGKLIDFD
jgi:hypothetical protein